LLSFLQSDDRREGILVKTAWRPLAAAALTSLALAAGAGETLYKSVDAAGNVTYSDEPPADAVQVQDVQVEPGPTPEAEQEAAVRSKQMTREADAAYDALMEQRRQQAEAREKARQEAEAARQRELERQRAAEDDTDDDATVIYTWPPWPPHHHPRPHPPRPPVPPTPPPEPEPGPHFRGNP
jgi:uncharacterized protein with WD repeat